MSERHGAGHGLNEHELSEIRMLIEERTGIHFDESRERFFSTRVREHLHASGLVRGNELLRAVRKSNVEYEALLERLLTQETSFFRYPAVYEAFEKRVLPELHTKKFWKNPRTLRVWSAGCSTGKSPIRSRLRLWIRCRLRMRGTWRSWRRDVGRQALKHAERAIYSGRSIGSVSEKQLATHFTPAENGQQVKPRLRKMISFAQMNLASPVYLGRMDLIFCMNVLIYFTEERRRALVQRFYEGAGAGRIPVSGTFGIDFEDAGEISSHSAGRLHSVPQTNRGRTTEARVGVGGARVEHAGPRSRRAISPGGLGAPAVFAGVRRRAAGDHSAARGYRAAVHCGAHAEGDFGELWISTIFRSSGKIGARISVCVERAAGRRSAWTADRNSCRTGFRYWKRA